MTTTLPALPARLTHDTAGPYLRQCETLLHSLPRGTPVQLDAAALTQFDTSALAVLLGLRRTAQTGQLAFEVQHMPARLRDLVNVYGVGELLPA